MLIEFTVENHKCFKDAATLNMAATRLKARSQKVNDRALLELPDGTSVLRTCALYGANASGKTNLLRAMHFMVGFVVNSAREGQSTDEIKVEPHLLNVDTADAPSMFEVVMMEDGTQYRYGFRITRTEVVEEWLYHVPTSRERRLFYRTGQDFVLSGRFNEGKQITGRTRSNALFLSVVAQFNGRIATKLLTWFNRVGFAFASEESLADMRLFTTQIISENADLQETVARVMKGFDVGITDITGKVRKVDTSTLPHDMPLEMKQLLSKYGSPETIIKTQHRVYDGNSNEVGVAEFDLMDQESAGTRKLFSWLGPILDSMAKGRVLFIDEIDAKMHPMMTRGLLDLISRICGSVGSKAQLVFTTHDTSLLSPDRFRRDQVWFVEKSTQGASVLYSLAEFRPRNDASFGKDYLSGRFGGIPFIRPELLFADSDQADCGEE